MSIKPIDIKQRWKLQKSIVDVPFPMTDSNNVWCKQHCIVPMESPKIWGAQKIEGLLTFLTLATANIWGGCW